MSKLTSLIALITMAFAMGVEAHDTGVPHTGHEPYSGYTEADRARDQYHQMLQQRRWRQLRQDRLYESGRRDFDRMTARGRASTW